MRHAHEVELAREAVALNVIQRQLGLANLGPTSVRALMRDRRHRDNASGPTDGRRA